MRKFAESEVKNAANSESALLLSPNNHLSPTVTFCQERICPAVELAALTEWSASRASHQAIVFQPHPEHTTKTTLANFRNTSKDRRTSARLESRNRRYQLIRVRIMVNDDSVAVIAQSKPLGRSRSRTRNFDMGRKSLSPHLEGGSRKNLCNYINNRSQTQ